MATSDDYVGDPHIRVVTWLHVVPHGTDYEKQHQEYLKYAQLDRPAVRHDEKRDVSPSAPG